jgi:DNA-directed RNA polymerase subunit RPC12/RpoP
MVPANFYRQSTASDLSAMAKRVGAKHLMLTQLIPPIGAHRHGPTRFRVSADGRDAIGLKSIWKMQWTSERPPLGARWQSAKIHLESAHRGNLMRPAVFDDIVVGIVCAECGECHRNPLRRLRDDREFICDNCGSKITLKNELLGADSQKFAKIMDYLRRSSDNPEMSH